MALVKTGAIFFWQYNYYIHTKENSTVRLSQHIPHQDFFEHYAEAVLITASDDTPLFINAAFSKLSGYTTDDISLLTGANLFRVRVNYDMVVNEKATHWETGITKKDNSISWAKVSVSPITLSDSSIGKIYTLADNPAIDQMKGLLKESETRFTTLADASPVMIWMTDQDNLCYYFNRSWLDFTGRKFEEELGSGWIRGVHTDDMKSFNDVNPLLIARQNYSCEYRLRKFDGTYRHILEIGTPRFLPDESFAGYMGSCLDITEMKMAQNELATQTQELKRSNEELEQFAYVASHDMQEPLRMISSYIQLVQKNIESGNGKEVNDFMKYVLEGVGRMQALINDLLHYSRVNKKGAAFGKVDLNEVLKIAVTHLTNRISENEAVLSYDVMPQINGDQSQLIRLFQNFIDNAIKFKASGRKPIIKISVKEQDNYFEIGVSDNGIGIDPKFYNRIFVIFQRLHTRSEYEGTGIGLAVCKKIVERHGGNIRLESKVEEGTTFYFTLKK
ncbi:MAG: ATP-binding protein [Bacteroidetes bacterium]|nr:ATP-binding protein [Bacteroidota bacterium]